MAQTILFDLDGTLTDPAAGITRSVAHALRHYGIEVSDLSTLHPFIGPPLDDSFERFYGFSHERAVEAIGYYREYFRDTGIFENEVYPGIPELLGALRAAGKTLAVATSKPEVFAVRILEHFGLAGYFSETVGSELDGTRVKKHEVIAEALRRTGAPKELEDCEAIRAKLADFVPGGFAPKEVDPALPGILKLLESVTEWRPPAKKGKKVYDDQEFVKSLADQFSRRHSLSPRQVAALKRVLNVYKGKIPDYAAKAAALGLETDDGAKSK